MLEVPVDLGAPYREWEYLPHTFALGHHSYASEDQVFLLVPEVNYEERVTALRALRFDVAKSAWLPPSRMTLEGHAKLAPRYSELVSDQIVAGYRVVWTSYLSRTREGFVFEPGSGAFRPARADELTSAPSYNGLARHAAFPPDPEPITGVSITADYPGATATFKRGGALLGTIDFPTIPGTYIAAFPATRAAFFWHNGRFSDQARLPPRQQRHSYLVDLESGKTCRIDRELAYPATAIFRRQGFLAFVNAIYTEQQRSDCPPGAPCVAPPQPHFERASLVVLRDLGPR